MTQKIYDCPRPWRSHYLYLKKILSMISLVCFGFGIFSLVIDYYFPTEEDLVYQFGIFFIIIGIVQLLIIFIYKLRGKDTWVLILPFSKKFIRRLRKKITYTLHNKNYEITLSKKYQYTASKKFPNQIDLKIKMPNSPEIIVSFFIMFNFDNVDVKKPDDFQFKIKNIQKSNLENVKDIFDLLNQILYKMDYKCYIEQEPYFSMIKGKRRYDLSKNICPICNQDNQFMIKVEGSAGEGGAGEGGAIRLIFVRCKTCGLLYIFRKVSYFLTFIGVPVIIILSYLLILFINKYMNLLPIIVTIIFVFTIIAFIMISVLWLPKILMKWFISSDKLKNYRNRQIIKFAKDMVERGITHHFDNVFWNLQNRRF